MDLKGEDISGSVVRDPWSGIRDPIQTHTPDPAPRRAGLRQHGPIPVAELLMLTRHGTADVSDGPIGMAKQKRNVLSTLVLR